MSALETEAKSILRKYKRVNSWFITSYGMNFYRGCTHDCAYCDGRAENYYTKGDFSKDITVKINAVEVLRKELDPKRRRKKLRRSFIMPCGGVGDSYEPLEKKYKLTRRALEVLYEFNFPVHILTKSSLVERDIDLLKKINKQNKVIISFSFSTADDKIAKIFEPGTTPPSQRLEVIKKFKSEGFNCGMFLMPVIPFVTDTPEKIYESIKQGKEAGIDFVIFSGMTLKEGKQKDYFMNVIKRHYPQLELEYNNIYPYNKWGNSTKEYYQTLNFTFDSVTKKLKVAKRIPSYIFKNVLAENDFVSVILDQIDYLLKLKGYKSNFGFAAYSISQLVESLSTQRGKLKQIKGVGPAVEKIIWEILDTGTSKYYEKLLYK
ncbi:MAG: hypothetical protein CR986_01675 [Ignavibacteriae bacterium]|nr:MAG: hypothetical protein CR986_01675 [Ignavibacteriota bacterium]